MKKTIEHRAVLACQNYVRIKAAIAALGREIGEALSKCDYKPEEQGDDCSHQPTHLRRYYAHGDLVGEWGFMGYGGPDYKAEFKACPHCVKAHDLIQQRKAARASFGAAKRQVARIGKEH